MLRICMVSDLYFPEPGGIAEHIYHLSRELRRRGHVCHVLTTSFGRSCRPAVTPTDDAQFVHRIGRGLLVPANRSLSRVTVGYRLGRQVSGLFAREGYDIVHIHGSLAPTLPLAALQHSRTLNVFTFHAGHDRSAGYRVFRRYLLRYFRRLHGLIAVSEAARRAMADYFPGDYRVIPNGIDIRAFHPDARPLPAPAVDRPRVLFLGRFDPRKGLGYLLRALPLVKRAVPDVQCVVVGSGPRGVDRYRRELDPALAADVIFTGRVPSSDRPRYYAGCSVFCAPSTGNESFGIILLEAMATARPVVASDIEGYREVLNDGVEGLLAPPCDEQALATRLIRILQNPELARTMGQAGRARAVTFSWRRVADQVEAYYRELLGRGSPHVTANS
jgi:phosphatidylinositol alpha-mannosyltransferase